MSGQGVVFIAGGGGTTVGASSNLPITYLSTNQASDFAGIDPANGDLSITMPISCSFHAIYFNGIVKGFAGTVTNNIAFTLVKNGAVTALSAATSIAAPIGSTASASNTNPANAVPVVAGDKVYLRFTQSDTSGTSQSVAYKITTSCR